MDRDLLVGCGQIALRRLGLAHRVGALGEFKGVGVAVGVGGEYTHGLPGRIEDGELRALKGVAVVAIGDVGVGAGLVQVDVTGDYAPANLEETCTGLGMASGNRHADDGLAAGDGEDADVLTVTVRVLVAVAILIAVDVGIGIVLEVRADTDVTASERKICLLVDFHRAGVLCEDVAATLDGVPTGFESGEVHALPTHGLQDGLVFIFSTTGVLDSGEMATGSAGGVTVDSLRAEGHTGPWGALELPCADVVHGHARLGHPEEAGDPLAEVIGHLHVHGMDARRGHGELKRAGIRVVLPHAHVGRVLDAVDRHAVDGAPGQGIKRHIIGREGHLGGRGGNGEGNLALTGDIAANIGGGAVEVEDGLSGFALDGVDELDSRGGHHRLALVVQLGVGLGHVHETGGLVHDEALAHLRVGVVLGSSPIGELGVRDVRTGPADVVVGIRVNFKEHGMGDRLREQGFPVLGETVAVLIGPELVERRIGELAAIDHGGGHGEHVRAGQLIALADVLGIRMVADVALDAGDGLALIDIHGLECRRTGAAVLIEGGGDDGVALHGEGGLALLDIDGGTVLLTLEHGDAVGEVPLIRGDVHRDIGADLDGQRHVLGAVERELAVLGLGERDGRKLRLGCVGRDGRERVEHGAGDEHCRHDFRGDALAIELALHAFNLAEDSFHERLLS